MGITKIDYEANDGSKKKQPQLELMEALCKLIAKDDSAMNSKKEKTLSNL